MLDNQQGAMIHTSFNMAAIYHIKQWTSSNSVPYIVSSLLEGKSYEPTAEYGDEELKVLAEHFIDECKLLEKLKVVCSSIEYIHKKTTQSASGLYTMNSLLRIHKHDDTIPIFKKLMSTYFFWYPNEPFWGFNCLQLFKE